MESKTFMNHFSKTVTILCVEDDETILEIYKELFSLLFKKVYFAKDGVEGLDIFKNESIDIVLTDYMMPKMDGLEMCEKIRRKDSSVPIILVTAMENIEVLRRALDLHVTSFLSKPFTSHSLFNVFNTAVKSVIADRTMQKEQKRLLDYSVYQENLSFEKEKLIAQNDVACSGIIFPFNCSVYYKAHDILSGDSYTIHEFSNKEYLLSIVDGMGKGLSASVSAMLCSAAINYYVSDVKEYEKVFVLKEFLAYFFRFIQPLLLEDEVVSVTFVLYNPHKKIMEYAIYSMPPILCVDKDDIFHKIRANNPPLGKYGVSLTTDVLKVEGIEKVLIYSDGLNENSVDGGEKSYAEYLQKHFFQSSNAQEFEGMVEKYITSLEDDITYIYLEKESQDD